MALVVKSVERIDPHVSKVNIEGEPVSAHKALSPNEILRIYRKLEALESQIKDLK